MIVESIIAILAAGTAASTVHRSVNPTAKEKQQQQKLKSCPGSRKDWNSRSRGKTKLTRPTAKLLIQPENEEEESSLTSKPVRPESTGRTSAQAISPCLLSFSHWRPDFCFVGF